MNDYAAFLISSSLLLLLLLHHLLLVLLHLLFLLLLGIQSKLLLCHPRVLLLAHMLRETGIHLRRLLLRHPHMDTVYQVGLLWSRESGHGPLAGKVCHFPLLML